MEAEAASERQDELGCRGGEGDTELEKVLFLAETAELQAWVGIFSTTGSAVFLFA